MRKRDLSVPTMRWNDQQSPIVRSTLRNLSPVPSKPAFLPISIINKNHLRTNTVKSVVRKSEASSLMNRGLRWGLDSQSEFSPVPRARSKVTGVTLCTGNGTLRNEGISPPSRPKKQSRAPAKTDRAVSSKMRLDLSPVFGRGPLRGFHQEFLDKAPEFSESWRSLAKKQEMRFGLITGDRNERV